MAHESFMIVDHSSQAPTPRRHLLPAGTSPRYARLPAGALGSYCSPLAGADHENTWTAELLSRAHIFLVGLDSGQAGGQDGVVANTQPQGFKWGASE